MDKERVLVTGATGFIGSAIFKRLKLEGYKVEGLSLHGGEVEGEIISSVDITSEEALVKYAGDKSYSAIFHLSACIPQSFNSPESEGCFYPNILSVKNILKLASSQRGCHILYASSVSVYGRNRDIPLTETSIPMPDNFYALSKYIGELLCQLYSNRIPITGFRISSPYGPGYTRPTVINIFCRKALRSEDINIFGSGKRCQDFIYIDDIVEAFVLSFKKRYTGVFNLCAGSSLSMYNLAKLIISLVPDTRSRIVFSGRPDPQETFRGVYSIDKASKVMGFSPKMNIQAGLKKTISWLQVQR